MAKTKLEKHMEELEEMTSGNSRDAVTFAGRGLDLLKSMIGMKKSAGEADEEEIDEDPEDPSETGEDQDEAKNSGKIKKSVRNGGDLSEADEDPEDPSQTGEDDEEGAKGGSIITNKGKKISKESSAAVKKSYEFDEDRFEKSFMDTYEDAIDASDALADLAKSVTLIGRSSNENAELVKSVLGQQVTLAKAIGELLKSQAALAADMEQMKKQPTSSPATGFVVMSKKSDAASGKTQSLRKSDIQDSLTDLMNDGVEGTNMLLKKLGVLHTNAELQEFMDNLPDEIKEKI